MIELNKKTQQDFLNREWVQRLLDAGVDMSDAKYNITGIGKEDYIILASSIPDNVLGDYVPTYTVSELLYKLHEWIYPTIDGKKFSGGLTFIKDAPFYMFYYKLHSENYDPRKLSNEQPKEWDESFMGECEYPIESLACLLIQCHKRDIGIKDKNGNQVSDTGNISDK
jgi:hypothetical protein